MTDHTRYALYYAPPAGTPLARLGAALLGRDATTGACLVQPDLPGLPIPLATLTAAPRRYGLHGTLKAPFRLRDGTTAADLTEAARALCAAIPAFDLPPLVLTDDWPFLALLPSTPCPALAALAETLVTRLDRFRAPPTEADRARRRLPELTPRQRDLFETWGYPYVRDEFRFHITLTGRLTPDQLAPVRAVLADYLGPALATPPEMREVCLFGEQPDGDFRLLDRLPLDG